MSIATHIDRINQNVANTYAVLDALGADMPAEQNSDNLAATAGTTKAVLYSEQELTDEQKAQARANIGAGTSDVTSWNDLEDRPFGSEKGWVEMLPETEFSGGSLMDGLYVYQEGWPVFNGTEEVINVTFDGVEYECNAMPSDGAILYGNMVYAGGVDTGEPFLIIAVPNQYGMLGLVDGEAHSMSINAMRTIYKTLDMTYLPIVTVYLNPSEFAGDGYIYMYKDMMGSIKCKAADIVEKLKSGAQLYVNILNAGRYIPVGISWDASWVTAGIMYNGSYKSLYTSEYTPTP